jgi:hypothetical protein
VARVDPLKGKYEQPPNRPAELVERGAPFACHRSEILVNRRRLPAHQLLSFTQGAPMSTIHFHLTTTSTPEQFIAGLTDFGPGRSKLFGNSADGYLKVHQQGSGQADVTEGSSGIWERLHYDWSDPNHVVLKTTDSNLWGGSSGHTYTLTRKPNGTTDVDVVVVREGKNFKGRALGTVLGVFGKGVLGKAFEKTLKAIEARNYEAKVTEVGRA